jgi:hypothetical protein
MEKIKELFDAVWGKYKSWPLWGKILGVLLLVAVVVLGFLYLVSKFIFQPSPAGQVDALHTEHVNENLKPLIDENEVLKKDVEAKKKEIYVKLNQARDIDQTTLDRREKIGKAATMDELDALQKEFGL